MNKTMKTQYETPTTSVVDIKMEGVICVSAPAASVLWFVDDSSIGSENIGWERGGYTGGSF